MNSKTTTGPSKQLLPRSRNPINTEEGHQKPWFEGEENSWGNSLSFEIVESGEIVECIQVVGAGAQQFVMKNWLSETVKRPEGTEILAILTLRAWWCLKPEFYPLSILWKKTYHDFAKGESMVNAAAMSEKSKNLEENFSTHWVCYSVVKDIEMENGVTAVHFHRILQFFRDQVFHWKPVEMTETKLEEFSEPGKKKISKEENTHVTQPGNAGSINKSVRGHILAENGLILSSELISVTSSKLERKEYVLMKEWLFNWTLDWPIQLSISLGKTRKKIGLERIWNFWCGHIG